MSILSLIITLSFRRFSIKKKKKKLENHTPPKKQKPPKNNKKLHLKTINEKSLY